MGRELASVNAGPESRRDSSVKPLRFETIGDGTWGRVSRYSKDMGKAEIQIT
jgi:hypothetical protein